MSLIDEGFYLRQSGNQDANWQEREASMVWEHRNSLTTNSKKKKIITPSRSSAKVGPEIAWVSDEEVCKCQM